MSQCQTLRKAIAGGVFLMIGTHFGAQLHRKENQIKCVLSIRYFDNSRGISASFKKRVILCNPFARFDQFSAIKTGFIVPCSLYTAHGSRYLLQRIITFARLMDIRVILRGALPIVPSLRTLS
jgi:hypothetical protein